MILKRKKNSIRKLKKLSVSFFNSKQVEREKRQLAKDAGMIRNEISGAEVS